MSLREKKGRTFRSAPPNAEPRVPRAGYLVGSANAIYP
jgi:hypothetical protein